MYTEARVFRFEDHGICTCPDPRLFKRFDTRTVGNDGTTALRCFKEAPFTVKRIHRIEYADGDAHGFRQQPPIARKVKDFLARRCDEINAVSPYRLAEGGNVGLRCKTR